MSRRKTNSVVISEPHPFGPLARYGGHQYAKVFARHGWEVILFSATFNLWRRFLPNSGIDQGYLDLWKAQGRKVDVNVTNYALAHVLPTQLRFRAPFDQIAPGLYSPSIRSVLASHDIQQADLLWLNGNQDWLLRRAIPHSKLLVRIIDDYSGFGVPYDNYHPLMKETLVAADGVFACSEKVRSLYSGFYEDIELAPNGVDFEHFTQVVTEEPDAISSIPHPRITYVGAIADWFDFDLVIVLAQRLPECHFVLFGKWSRPEPVTGSYPENVHVMGPIEYAKVPAISAFSDVAMIPFKDTELVRGVSPIKVYEYLASRLPVVSLRWDELARESLPIFLASNAGEFEKGILNALSMTDEQRDALREVVRQYSWEQRLRHMLAYLDLELDQPGRSELDRR
ncbi:MAG: glycosyltransferase [Caldilinea sp.]|nr:glycosyltransferase [Caldilineaceae bacterium]MCW5840836.1 glycosyltransferase [Caldilinea sp.]